MVFILTLARKKHGELFTCVS